MNDGEKLVWKLKMLNKVILKRRLLLKEMKNEIRTSISKDDLSNLKIALDTTENFDDLYELIKIM